MLSELAMWIEKRTLSLKEIQELNELDQEDMILVNVNRIYSKYSEAIRENLSNEYQILLGVISKICDDKEMYTTMKISDVLACFTPQTREYPENTFLSKNEKRKNIKC